MKVLDQIGAIIDRICKHIIVYLLAVITIVLFIQVVARFVFNTGTFWTDELARFSMIWLVFLGAAIATRDRSLINIDILESTFPSWKKGLHIFQLLVSIVFFALLLKVGWETMGLVAAQRSPNMGVSMSIVYASIPVAMILSIYFAIVRVFYRNNSGGENT